MGDNLFSSDPWNPTLQKYAEAAGLTVELFDVDGQVVLDAVHPTPLFALFEEYRSDPGLFAECASRCLSQTDARPAVVVTEAHGLAVVGTSLKLEGEIVGSAVAGYALARFTQVPLVRRWAESAGVPFNQLWNVARQQSPVSERRLKLHGELLQVLGDALLRENFRTRQYEESVVELQAAASAKDEFLAVLSHELRTPLTPIRAWADMLKLDDRPEQVRRAADAIERGVSMQSRMIEDLLDVNRITRGKVMLEVGNYELAALVRAAMEASAQDVESKAIGLEVIDAGEPLCIEGDVGRLQQVFRNVLSNAVKFTPCDGHIRVTLGREADTARVVVADTGKGIAPEFLPYVFDIFRQQEQGTRREHGGLGIGLALVKRLTELHGGTVSVTSAGAGGGTEVEVRLPLAADIPTLDDTKPASAQLSASSLTGLSVLVVEDSEDSRESLRMLLELLGAEVSVAKDGREALEIVRDGNPNLVLCDLRMPRMDGFEFMRELQRMPAPGHPPVVAMSGLASDADRRRTREAGFEGHIGKPFDKATVVAAVGAALSHAQER